MKKIMILAMVMVLCFVGMVQANRIYNAITMAQYERIETGQPKELVNRIFGRSGTQISQAGTVESVMWDNHNYGNCVIMFLNGKVLSKSQFGLP